VSKRFLPPDGAVLNAFVNANLTWLLVLGEWIDNAFDAGAETISFDFSQNMCRIWDDGNGCADPATMIQLGAHEKQTTTELGRYGIGGKDAALWVGGLDSVITISTIRAQRLRSLTVNWREYAKEWNMDETTERPADVHERGTFIRISPRMRTPPSGKDLRQLLDKLGYLYAPGIRLGKKSRSKDRKTWSLRR
jgi:Histidine kinase-, DNA gyrase B-, and HSP90-like ATPase